MKNGFVLLAVAVSLAGFAGMMRIKTDVQTLSRERLRLAKEQMVLRETKRVLEAEWAHVANPLRLQRLAATRNYVPLGMEDIVVLDPPTPAQADAPRVTGASVWRRALGRQEEPAAARPAYPVMSEEAPAPRMPAGGPAAGPGGERAPALPTALPTESVMDALDLPDGGTD